MLTLIKNEYATYTTNPMVMFFVTSSICGMIASGLSMSGET